MGDRIEYNHVLSFDDYFVEDNSNFLDRRLPESDTRSVNDNYFPWFVIVLTIIGFIFIKKKLLLEFVAGVGLLVAAYGLLLRSYYDLGWKVYYGPVTHNLMLVQVLIVLLVFSIIFFINKLIQMKNNKYTILLILIPLIFGLEVILRVLRYTYIEGRHYLGFSLDALRFVGISYQDLNIRFINQDFPSPQASALLRFDFSSVYENLVLWIIVYPFFYIIIAYIGWLIIRKRRLLTIAVFCVLAVLYVVGVYWIFNTDPRIVITL